MRMKLEDQVKQLMAENEKLVNRFADGDTKLDKGNFAKIRKLEEELENKVHNIHTCEYVTIYDYKYFM